MAKNGSTKNKILGMIAGGNKTLSDISRELDLAPSTVSQHLQELKSLGAVEEVQNEHIKKWKYYRLNPNFDQKNMKAENGVGETQRGNISNKVFLYSVGILVLVAVAYLIVSYLNVNVQRSSLVQIKLTDPPIVPQGTQALYINYSSVSIHAIGTQSSEWIESNASGSVNLLSLINFSQVMARIEVTQNSKVNYVRFNITSAYIVINGTSYNVTVPSGQISTRILGNGDVNSSSEVLVDLSPTVAAMYVNNTAEFVMLPQVKAVVSQYSGGAGQISVGGRVRLNNHEVEKLYNSQSNLSIEAASLSVGKNGTTDLSITIKNNGNSSVGLSNLIILGNQTPVTTLNFTCSSAANASTSNAVSQWCNSIEKLGLKDNASRVNFHDSFNTLQRVAYSRGIGFIIERNGTVELASGDRLESEVYPYTPFNYTMAPGSTVTFSYNGQLALSGNLEIALVEGAHYRLGVLGQQGSHILQNITAT